MKITRVETWTVPVTLEAPYAVAYAAYDRTTLAFVRLTTDRGVVGFGSAGCDADVTGETADTVVAAGVRCPPLALPETPMAAAFQYAPDPTVRLPLTWIPAPVTVTSALPASTVPRKQRAQFWFTAVPTTARACAAIGISLMPAATPNPVVTSRTGITTQTLVGAVVLSKEMHRAVVSVAVKPVGGAEHVAQSAPATP